MSIFVRCAAIAVGAALLSLAQTSEKATPFANFIREVKRAEAKEFLHKPGVEVEDAIAFDQMRQYILALYQGVHVRRSYTLNTQLIDCVPENEQPSLRGRPSKQSAAPPAISPGDSKQAEPPGGCATGSIPMRRVTLKQLTRFKTLDDSLHKEPHGRAPMPSR
jgi:hypothetical protein